MKRCVRCVLPETFPNIKFDKDGIYQLVKGNIKDLYLPPKELLGKKITTLLPQNVAVIAIENINKTLQTGEPQVFAKRKIYFNQGFLSFFIYHRRELIPGNYLKVPAVVVSDDSTVVVGGNFTAYVDEYSNIILTRKKT